MAERRMLSRRVAQSKKLAQASWQAEAFYYRCLPFTDDAGRLVADPEEFRSTVCPRGKRGKQVPITKVQEILCELHNLELIDLYSSNGNDYLQVVKFSDFQTLKKDRKPTIKCPGPDDVESTGIQWNTTESLREVKRREVKLREEKLREVNSTPKNGFEPAEETASELKLRKDDFKKRLLGEGGNS